MNFRLPLLLALALTACAAGSDKPSIIDSTGKPRVLRFVVFGDAGSGSAQQIAIGQAMADVCQMRGCDLALEVGDNFYDHGVDSARDPQFDTAFEIPYAPLDHQRIPIYLVLGNHDNTSLPIEGNRLAGDGGGNARGNFEVEYARRDDRPSKMFRMPDRFYKFEAPQPGFGEAPFAEFFALDSSPLAPYRDDPDQESWNPEAYFIKQESWLRQQLQGSRARWTIAFGHHPYISNGQHGNAGRYDEDIQRDKSAYSKYAPGQLWKKLLDDTVCEKNVSLYLSGHDHDLEWLKPPKGCGNTQFVLSGAGEGGGKRRPFGRGDRNKVYWQQDQVGGFFWIELTENQMKIAAFTVGDNGMLPRDSGQRPVPAFEKTVDHTGFECDEQKDLEKEESCRD
jgi:hypothetical protein